MILRSFFKIVEWGCISMLKILKNVDKWNSKRWNMLNDGENVEKWGWKNVDEFENAEKTLNLFEKIIRS